MDRPRIKNDRILLERIQKFISPIYFADVNLYSGLYVDTVKIPSLLHFQAPDRISYNDATSDLKRYQEIIVGKSFGSTWSTHWFQIDVDLSLNQNWIGKEVRLRWNSNSEAMVWQKGVPMQGLTGGDNSSRFDYIVSRNCKGSEKLTLYIEMACNGLFGAGKDGMINTPDPDQTFTLSKVELSVLDKEIYTIIQDLKLIIQIVQELPKESEFRQHALQVGCDVVNCFQPEKPSSNEQAMSMLDNFFKVFPRDSRGPFTIHAMGHCHIDTAWLWPYAETRRKCARSWSSSLGLMSRFPNFKFTCSQAVQLAWLKEDYPVLFTKIFEYVKNGQFIPTGGSWVEMDGNIPSGESFIRQFFYGQHFFKKEFGSLCEVFWLPDTFGYSAQLPQIAKQCGIKYFLTQKISWSLINTFPHNSFIWQGIDGTKLLTHFPPADTYESSVSVKDVLNTSTKNKDKGIVNDGILLYGFGDGGGGPNEDMIYNIERLSSLPSFPKIKHSTPQNFFKSLERIENKLHTWIGELYLELHQGTFTTQAFIKKNNREFEQRLFNVEFLQVYSLLLDRSRNDSRCDDLVSNQAKINDVWKNLLLNQFHDVLPGTSIKLVNDDVRKIYQDMNEILKEVTNQHHEILIGSKNGSTKAVINTNTFTRKEVVSNNGVLELVSVPALSLTDLKTCIVDDYTSPVVSECGDGNFILQNEYIKTTLNKFGQITSCVLLKNNRDCILPNSVGNSFTLYTDIPLYWDAWDVMPYNNETGQILNGCVFTKTFNEDNMRAGVKVSLKISDKSMLHQTISLDASSKYIRFDTKVIWYENRKILKVKFPLNVHTDYATYDIQCGHIKRPTHVNTSWDWAKHEVCGHKWVDVSEFNFGAALLNDCKYGFSAYGSTLEMSLLRAPKSPDDEADMGIHNFSYALMPHTGSFQNAGVVSEAQAFNNPMTIEPYNNSRELANAGSSLFSVDNQAVVIQAIKPHHKLKNGVVIRMFESFGGHVDVLLTSLYTFKQIKSITPLEDDTNMLGSTGNETCLDMVNEKNATFKMKPFEILSLLLEF